MTGDCRDILPTLPEASVQCVVTSPPYWGLRDYGCDGQIGLEPTPEEYVAALVGVFREVRRVLRDDGTCWVNLGDSYAGSSMSGGVGSGTLAGTQHGERKGGDLRFSGARTLAGLKAKDLVGIPWRVAFALQADGWWLRSDIIWAKPNPMPESVTDRPTKAHEYVFLLAKGERYYYDADAIREASVYPEDNRKARQRPADYADRAVGDRIATINPLNAKCYPERNRRSVWTITTEPYPEAHFATFPAALVQPCILAGSRVGDTVLDPFGGSGTVGEVAETLGRDSILIELNPKYVELAGRRTAQSGLFAQRRLPT